ncbi:NAD(P)/FAD-dependent oxidoreductase [Dongia rigui]|uniref:FAD-dependent oxidoreductase n=1 Tax=Dongia rigui TaxID=940149 RepID=A0ABU5DZ27_9PROT|nr:FAD-dependent oxidoreductase [Dongia rigui]MDY0872546.1 FAD-dependent oxidoreductase [Dongia rigui]
MGNRHFIVIGAGIVGVSAALYLQKDGNQVTVIDGRDPGEGTSKGNASVIATESCIPVATPGILWDVPKMLMDPLSPLAIRWSYLPQIAPWLIRFVAASSEKRVEQISIALRSVLVHALAAHKELAGLANQSLMIKDTGWLGVFETDKKFDSYQWDLALQKRRGVEFKILKQEEIRQFEPSLNPIYRHAVYFPENSYVTDNFALVQRLANQFVAGGGRIVKADVTGFEIGADGPKAVKAGGNTYPCDAVVVAAGAWSKKLTAMLGHKVPLDTERGYHVTLPNAQKRPRMPIYSADHSFAITPLDVGLRFAGTVELGGLDLPPNYDRAQKLMNHGKRMFGDLDETGRSDWMGFRPSMPDSVPVIAQGERFKNTFFGFGHGHIGLTLGPVTGRIIADLAAGRDPGVDLAPFRIDRF